MSVQYGKKKLVEPDQVELHKRAKLTSTHQPSKLINAVIDSKINIEAIEKDALERKIEFPFQNIANFMITDQKIDKYSQTNDVIDKPSIREVSEDITVEKKHSPAFVVPNGLEMSSRSAFGVSTLLDNMHKLHANDHISPSLLISQRETRKSAFAVYNAHVKEELPATLSLCAQNCENLKPEYEDIQETFSNTFLFTNSAKSNYDEVYAAKFETNTDSEDSYSPFRNVPLRPVVQSRYRKLNCPWKCGIPDPDSHPKVCVTVIIVTAIVIAIIVVGIAVVKPRI